MRFLLILIYIGISFSSIEMSYQFEARGKVDIANEVSTLLSTQPQNHQEFYNLDW